MNGNFPDLIKDFWIAKTILVSTGYLVTPYIYKMAVEKAQDLIAFDDSFSEEIQIPCFSTDTRLQFQAITLDTTQAPALSMLLCEQRSENDENEGQRNKDHNSKSKNVRNHARRKRNRQRRFHEFMQSSQQCIGQCDGHCDGHCVGIEKEDERDESTKNMNASVPDSALIETSTATQNSIGAQNR